jgi:hypothetical protein
MLFCTTRQFLEYFGLKSLEELPKIENFPDFLTKKEEEMESLENFQTEHNTKNGQNGMIVSGTQSGPKGKV